MREREKLRAERKARELAEEHWEWVSRWLHMVYVDAFVHGYKHSVDANLIEEEKEDTHFKRGLTIRKE